MQKIIFWSSSYLDTVCFFPSIIKLAAYSIHGHYKNWIFQVITWILGNNIKIYFYIALYNIEKFCGIYSYNHKCILTPFLRLLVTLSPRRHKLLKQQGLIQYTGNNRCVWPTSNLCLRLLFLLGKHTQQLKSASERNAGRK